MPQTRLAARLETSEVRIGLTRASIDIQRGVIEDMRLKGYVTGDAATHLTVLETRLVLHEAERGRLRAELGAPATVEIRP